MHRILRAALCHALDGVGCETCLRCALLMRPTFISAKLGAQSVVQM